MNQPVGKRYVDRLIPLGPNSRSDGSICRVVNRIRHAISVRAHYNRRS